LVHYGDDPNELGWEKTPEEYVQRLCNILMKCYDRLKDTGSMFVNLGETYEDGQCLGVTDMLVLELRRRGVRFVDRIIWNKGSSSKPNRNNIKRLNNGYETILHFSKSKDYYFERFKIKSDKTLKVSKGCKEKGSNKVGYHIPNNYKQFRSVLSENEVSNIISVQINRNRTKHTEGEEVHPAVFSNNLPVVPLLISTPKNRDSVVMDPFMGSGSCGVTALQLGFKFVGVELYEKNIKTAERVMSEAQESFDESSLNSMFDDFGVSGNSDMNLEDIQEVA
jgi:DNA modification methylase